MTKIQEQVLQEGTHIGVYEIKDVISTDDYGITYRAFNQHLNLLVAIMEYFPCDLAIRHVDGATVRPKSDSNQTTFKYGLQKFLQHADILAETKYQSIVGVHNVLQFNETVYLVMDLEEGVSLSKQLDLSPSFSEAELKALLRSLLNALQNSHENGSVHGDIHPGNIIIRKNGDPVLINFSAARLAFSAHNNRLQQVLRTGYAPPELYEPGNLPGPTSDLYALGATMYRCITHSDPIPALERVKALNNNQPDPLQTNFDASDTAFNEDILKPITWMLNPNANERAQSAQEVLALLDINLEETHTMATADAQKDDELKASTSEATAAQSHGGLILSSVFGIVILIAAGFWFLKQDKQPETVASNTDIQTSVELNKEIKNAEMPEDAEPKPAETTSLAELDNISPSDQQPPAKVESSEIKTAEAVTNPPDDKVLSTKVESEAGSKLSNEIETVPQPKSQVLTASEDKEAVTKPKNDIVLSTKEKSEAVAQLSNEPKTVLPPQNQVSSVIEDNKDEQIKQHLAIAQEHIEALRLTTPRDKNAYQHYLAILEIDPENINANKGLQQIVNQYILFINSAVHRENFKAAYIYLKRAEKILPDSPELQRLRQELTTKVRESLQ